MGDVPVIASRIQTVAQPGTVVLSEATAQLIGTELRLDDLGPRELKGLSAPVRLYTIAAAEVAVQAADAPVEGGVVGREVELATLHGCWELARGRRGQVVLLTGEAGIGKSRITQALASGAAGAAPVLRFECSPYRGGTALWPVIEHLARSAGIRQGDPTETFSFTLSMDATDQLARPENDPQGIDARLNGISSRLAALERLMFPAEDDTGLINPAAANLKGDQP